MPDIPGWIENLNYIGIFFLLVLGGVGLPFPEDFTMMFCGYLIASGTLKPVYTVIAAYSGLLLADFILYSAGRVYGEKIISLRWFRKRLTPERLERLRERFKRQGVLFVFLGRMIVGLRAQVFIASGIMKVPRIKFIIADAIAAAITMTVMMGAGYAGGNSINILRKGIVKLEHIVILLMVTLIPVFIIHSYLSNRNMKI